MGELNSKDLRIIIKENEIDCETTEELDSLDSIVGQDRAVKALKFGLNIHNKGFNIFVSGIPGTGRTTGVNSFVNEIAKEKPRPNDWCYVKNFENSYEPKTIELKAGLGNKFKNDMKNFIEKLKNSLPKAFSGKDYLEKKESITKKVEEERNKLITDLKERAKKEGFVLKQTAFGLFFLPVVDGKVLNEEQFMSLEKGKREQLKKKRKELNEDLKSTMNKVRKLDKEIEEDTEKLDKNVALYTMGPLVDEIKEKYKDNEKVQEYIDAVQKDVLENIKTFLKQDEQKKGSPFSMPWIKEAKFRKYEVNVVIDNSEKKGAPVIVEHNPNYKNLFGKLEKEAQFGILTTDFTMIRNGALHKANGGFLILPVEELLKNPFSWDSLKIALRDKKIDIEEAGEKFGLVTTKGLKPEPIPLDLKIILIGRPLFYNLLFNYDNDFKKLFKVKADFDWVMDKNKDNVKKYASFVCTFCNKENLKHLHVSAVAKIIEHGLRISSDKEKLSTKFSEIGDIIYEANYYAQEEDSKYINSGHIQKAINEKIYRSNLIQEKIQEMIERSTILIDISGEVVGQVNGLSITSVGNYSFGKPSRVTANVGIGKEGIVDIERETKLGGPVHSKGVMILSGYMINRYAQDKPFNLSARLVFEQSYSGVEGDSASSAELYALISSLSGLPLKQNIAVTGSVNQKGEVQAIGGVNEKIEGFFEICKIKGLDGSQGVIIPTSNEKNLMLKEEIVKAVGEGKFHIYSVDTIDEGIEILTGVKAGKRLEGNNFEKDSVNYKVNERMHNYLQKLKEYSQQST
ncbi:MAG: Lon protease family protein [Actinomycetota bacterium]